MAASRLRSARNWEAHAKLDQEQEAARPARYDYRNAKDNPERTKAKMILKNSRNREIPSKWT